VTNTSNKEVTAAIYLIDPATGQNIPIVLGTVSARSVKLFDKFITDNKIQDCTPIVVWILLDKKYLPPMTNLLGVISYTASPTATLYRVVSGGATLDMSIDQRAVNNTPT
jgi:uncharacterized protein YggT (Ycf19 family)